MITIGAVDSKQYSGDLSAYNYTVATVTANASYSILIDGFSYTNMTFINASIAKMVNNSNDV